MNTGALLMAPESGEKTRDKEGQLRAARKTLSEEIAAIDEKYTRRLKIVFRLWHTLCKILSHG
ncbi:MAG: hypothetical protein IKY16_04080 [Bacteroidales bacterium]|nr:hypothetical protein [Bacteroidales bacterium]